FEKKNSKSKKKKKDDDDKKKSSSKKKEKFVAPTPDPKVQPFFDLREGELSALFSIGSAAAYEHLIDAIDDEEFEWGLRIPLRRDIDVFHVKDKVGERGVYTVMEPLLTLQPGTMRQRNLPAEFERAGAKLVLLPRSDRPSGFESFLVDVGVMIGAGLDRAAAVRGVTQHPADMLGLGDEVGTLEEGKRANLLVLSGDPFQPGTKIEAVLLDGEFVIGDIDQ
ncbi:MAG: amidohydrolase family protein, partial [Planctomycetota bacterium]